MSGDADGVTVAPARDDEIEACVRLREQAFHADPAERAERVADERARAERFRGRRLVAREGPAPGEVVGTLFVHPFGQWFGGRSVPCGGVAGVAVLAERRGRGIASALVDAALVQMRERGELVSALHPATLRPYRRAGWEVAGDRPVVRVPAADLAALGPPGEAVRPARLEPDRDRIRACYATVAAHRPGWLDRPEHWWDRVLDVRSERHEHLAVVDRGEGGAIAGYVRWRQLDHPAGDSFAYGIEVQELVACDRDAERDLWAVLGGHSAQVDAIDVTGGSLHVLEALLSEVRVREHRRMPWMLRLVDAPCAIAARGWPNPVRARIGVRLTDGRAPWNSGAWTLEIEPGSARLEAGGAPELELDGRGLAALYSGWRSTTELRDAGLLRGGAPDALAALDAAFAGPRPSIADMF